MYEYKTEPFRHQREEFELSRDMESRALFWEMGCVDRDTEYLSPVGWRRVSEYDGGAVAQWDPETGAATWAEPREFVVLPCEKFYRISGARGTDQVLSEEHRVPILTKRGDRYAETISARTLAARLFDGRQVRLPSKFMLDPTGPGIGMTDDQLRLQVAVMADGHFPKDAPITRRCTVRVKKPRKVVRLRELLRGVDGVHERHEESTGFTVFRFQAPLRAKEWPREWWLRVSAAQRDVLLDEVHRWDGTDLSGGRGWAFYSRHEHDVDFVQFLAASAGMVTSKAWSGNVWQLSVRGTRTNGFVVTRRNLSVVDSEDGRKYCFVMPSGYWIARRSGRPFPTGNCGKTKPMIDTAAWLYEQGKIDAVFALSPKAVAPNWIYDEIPAHLPDRLRDSTRLFLWETNRAGGKGYQRQLPGVLAHDGLLFVSMSYSGLMTQKRPGWKLAGVPRLWKGKEFAGDLLRGRRCLFIVDESARVKDPNTKRSKRVIAASKLAPFRRVMTGTPVANSPFDVYTQLMILDPDVWKRLGCDSFLAFKNVFGEWVEHERNDNGQKFRKLVEYRNLHDLHQIVDSVGSRLLKTDVLDLPPKLYSKRYFDMCAEQAALYKELKREFMVWLDSGEMITAPLVITRLLRLQQITSGYCPVDGGGMVRIEPNRRLELLQEILEDCPHQAIVWAKFQEDVDQIAALLGDDCVTYDGRTSHDDRELARNRFQAGDVRVFVGNPAAAGEGLTLHRARTVVYYNTTFKLAERLQSEDRAHRIGQEHPVHYIDLVARGTVDNHIVRALRGKFDVANIVTGDAAREWI